ncbi:zinc ribbon domain-containing protein [Acidithiobacillus sp. IBUN Pt1247-S3]|uniref:FmdB family zinc ribbon protein n=1 Tax=Acidithiobacillus sp. IBUN Pt1247-S3 TaxID=3166642 RepID=UPI0034E6142F
MPLYEFECTRCGSFQLLRPMNERNENCSCPSCGNLVSRIAISAPALSLLSKQQRSAHATNEKSRHEPSMSADIQTRSRHPTGCGCCNGKKSLLSPIQSDSPKGFPGKRPWMISH